MDHINVGYLHNRVDENPALVKKLREILKHTAIYVIILCYTDQYMYSISKYFSLKIHLFTYTDIVFSHWYVATEGFLWWETA